MSIQRSRVMIAAPQPRPAMMVSAQEAARNERVVSTAAQAAKPRSSSETKRQSGPLWKFERWWHEGRPQGHHHLIRLPRPRPSRLSPWSNGWRERPWGPDRKWDRVDAHGRYGRHG